MGDVETRPIIAKVKKEDNKKCLICTICFVALLVAGAIVVLGVGLGLGLKSEAASSNPTGPTPTQPYQHAAVAADAAVCSQVGVDILKKNGSAVDAAIASLFCVGVVNLHSTGIGGGGFMVYYNATSRKSTFIDYREVAPLNSTANMFDNASSDIGE
jgi:gamma-glutamyltranspeptidase/glutathione hydrolase/leukotriene-C4 hydrolase